MAQAGSVWLAQKRAMVLFRLGICCCLVFFISFSVFFWVVLLEMIVVTMLKKIGSAGLAQKSAMVHFRLSFCRRRPFNYFLCCLILHRGHHCSASRDLQLILPTFSSSVTSYITSYHIISYHDPYLDDLTLQSYYASWPTGRRKFVRIIEIHKWRNTENTERTMEASAGKAGFD